MALFYSCTVSYMIKWGYCNKTFGDVTRRRVMKNKISDHKINDLSASPNDNFEELSPTATALENISRDV